jgi:ribonuclease PH
MQRHDGRGPEELRPIRVERGFTTQAPGSLLIQAGGTMVLCTASISPEVPPWLAGQAKGWITAEYSMLPGSTRPRKARDRGLRTDGRTTEIQRLIGRSLRAVADLEALGERLVTVDCDVLQADGGTRTWSITGALMALVDALQTVGPWQQYPLRDSVAAISVGVVDGQVVTDLDYQEDARASVDMNLVMTGGGKYVEVQGTGEQATFDEPQLAEMLRLGRKALQSLTILQRSQLESAWPWNEPSG